MGAVYSNTSPWYNTPTTQDYLDILTIRAVASQPDDFFYTIQAQYNMRPDLLAFNKYLLASYDCPYHCQGLFLIHSKKRKSNSLLAQIPKSPIQYKCLEMTRL